MANLPTPAFSIGDTIYVPRCEDSREHALCPDCFGAGEWPVTSPAGEEHSVRCPSCSKGGWGDSTGKVEFYKAIPAASRLTVGSVRIDTAAAEGERVSYMCVETGVGSGLIYYECKCFAHEAAALEVAALSAHEQTNRIRASNKKNDDLKVLPIQSADTKKARDRAFAAECALESLKHKIIDLEVDGYRFSKSDDALLHEVSLYLVEEDDSMREEAA